MEPKFQKAYAIEGIAKKWCADNEEEYVDTGDMLRDFGQILELSRELMVMLQEPITDRVGLALKKNLKAYINCEITEKQFEENKKYLEERRLNTGKVLRRYELEVAADEAEEPTLTIFRKYPDGDIVALFPEIVGAPGLCWSYMHVGQHGSADYDLVVRKTKRATPEEYANLQEELEGIDYNLKIRQKWMRR